MPREFVRAGLVTNVGVLPGDTFSVARAINDNGVVAGSSYVTDPTEPFFTQYFHALRYTPGLGSEALGTLGSKVHPESRGLGLNSSGVVIGSADPSAFIYSGAGPMQGLPLSYASEINNAGAIVGQLSNSHAGLYVGSGSPTDFGTLPGSSQPSVANALNSSSTVVGYAQTSNFVKHAFRWTSATGMVSLDSLSATDGSVAWDINSAGVITGSDGNNAFRYSGSGPMQLLPKGTFSSAVGNAINDAGYIVGTGGVSGPIAFDAVLWKPDNTMIDLDAWLNANSPADGANWQLQHAYGINSFGQIVGDGVYNDGPGGLPDSTYGYVLDAAALVPEPSAVGLVLLGGGSVLLRRASNKRAGVR